jgi:hypothetical protein
MELIPTLCIQTLYPQRIALIKMPALITLNAMKGRKFTRLQ